MVGWAKDRLANSFNTTVEKGLVVAWLALFGVLLIGVGYAWTRRSKDVPIHFALPMWLLGLIALLVVGSLILFVRRAGRGVSRGAVEPAAWPAAADTARFLDYAEHLNDALESMQKVIRGTIPNVTFAGFVETGLLQPAREFLVRRHDEDVRLSVLVPDGNEWKMAFAAGYRLESKHRFALSIDASFSRHAYESGAIQWSDDLPTDSRFIPHAKATREYLSIVSTPLFAGDEVVAVFNVDSTVRAAFDGPDMVYIGLIGAILDVVLSHIDMAALPEQAPTETPEISEGK